MEEIAQRFSGGSLLEDLKATAESYKSLIVAAFDKGKLATPNEDLPATPTQQVEAEPNPEL